MKVDRFAIDHMSAHRRAKESQAPKGSAMRDWQEFANALHDIGDELVKVYRPPLERLAGWIGRVLSLMLDPAPPNQGRDRGADTGNAAKQPACSVSRDVGERYALKL